MINRAYFINKGALCRWIQIPLDVGVYHPPSSQQYFVDCTDRLRRTAPRSKPVRLVLEVRFEDWLNHYPTRLLDNPVSHCRNPQGPLAAIWLGNVYPQHRLGVVSSCLQIRRKYLEKRCYALSLHLVQAHAIGAGTASVGFHFLPGPPQYVGPEYAVIERKSASFAQGTAWPAPYGFSIGPNSPKRFIGPLRTADGPTMVYGYNFFFPADFDGPWQNASNKYLG